ncbi:MAG: rhodanese-like domain-containing protein [Bacteroidia bacterium]|nr:rhodanese-like domain-containing protein [Bacteroidia bacterium]
MKLEKIIQSNLGTILDVRTKGEFVGGHAADSINIPLHEITARMEEIKKLKTPVVLCCASGGRSAQASFLLSSHQIECIDAGPWMAVHSLQS